MNAMDHTSYSGPGPSCYDNCFAMMLGEHAPSAAVIEFSTGSAFGMHLVSGALPFVDSLGWIPTASFDFALKAMGWESTLTPPIHSNRRSMARPDYGCPEACGSRDDQ